MADDVLPDVSGLVQARPRLHDGERGGHPALRDPVRLQPGGAESIPAVRHRMS